MKKIILLITAFAVAAAILTGCSNAASQGDITKLSFSSASGYDYLKTLDGTTVTISGYMATSSPVDGSFMFLMNLPYQNCPFCVPNTSQLSNTMEVYPKDGDSFGYTAQAIKVVGTLEVAEKEDEPFTDMYGYQFNFKIVDATYTIIKSEDLSEDMALWQEIAASGVVEDIYAMYDYMNFLTAWNTYYTKPYMDENGNTVPGSCLDPATAKSMLYTQGAQFNYGYQQGYFENIINSIEKIDATAFSDLTANVRAAQKLAEKALAELENQNYTTQNQYIEPLGTEGLVYVLHNGEAMRTEFNALYYEFANWLGSWEM